MGGRGRGKGRFGRPVDGLLLLDKHKGGSSNAALQEVRRLYGAAKAGHSGSLDPLATGVLPLCFGKATKFSQFMLNSDKGYRVEICLGVRTDSGDADGKIIQERPVPKLTEAQIDTALDAFRGDFEQVPPMFSAIKHQGRPLYELARQGLEVERKPRAQTVRENRILEFEGERLLLQILCSKGTYVRAIAEELGEALGCGAHVAALRRTAVGPFNLDDAHTLETLEAVRREGGHAALDHLLKPVEMAVAHWPAVRLSGRAAYYLSRGQPVVVAHAPTAGWVRICEDAASSSRFLGVGEVLDDGRIAPRCLLGYT